MSAQFMKSKFIRRPPVRRTRNSLSTRDFFFQILIVASPSAIRELFCFDFFKATTTNTHSFYKFQPKVFKLIVNFQSNGPHQSTLGIFEIFEFSIFYELFLKISNSPLYHVEKQNTSIIWKTSDRRAKQSEILDSWAVTFPSVLLKALVSSANRFFGYADDHMKLPCAYTKFSRSVHWAHCMHTVFPHVAPSPVAPTQSWVHRSC